MQVNVSLRIREIREAKGISLSAVSRITGIAPSYLSELENEVKKNIGLVVLCKIALALGEPLEKLIEVRRECA